jgi:ABC-type phosphate/phosphonate transport system permease subunit
MSLKEPPEEDFSPGKALLLSLPLFIILGANLGPRVWDLAAAYLGWTGPNMARELRELFTHSVLLRATAVAAVWCLPKAFFYCRNTVGFDWLRFTLRALILIFAYLLCVGRLYEL